MIDPLKSNYYSYKRPIVFSIALVLLIDYHNVTCPISHPFPFCRVPYVPVKDPFSHLVNVANPPAPSPVPFQYNPYYTPLVVPDSVAETKNTAVVVNMSDPHTVPVVQPIPCVRVVHDPVQISLS